MNNGTNETFKVLISEYKINPNDDIIYTRILDAIEPSLKKRVSEDVHYEYELLGISTSPDGEIINTADYKPIKKSIFDNPFLIEITTSFLSLLLFAGFLALILFIIIKANKRKKKY